MELTHPDDAISTLLGAALHGADGRRIGRIVDVLAEWRGDGAVVVTGVLVRRRALRSRARSVEIPWWAIAEVDGRFVARADG